MEGKKKLRISLIILGVFVAVALVAGKVFLSLPEITGTPEAVETAVTTEPPEPPEPTQAPTPSPTPTPDFSKTQINNLTGLYINREAAERRPFAVVINNIHKALPQSGIARADIVYEVLAEGDITRLIAIFQNFDAPRIGPVRSTRHYFLYFALDHDAYFVHHGGSPQGYNSISSWGINNFDGMALDGGIFWRDQDRVNRPGMYEHSSYTSSANILKALDNTRYRTEKNEDTETVFNFYPGRETPEGAELAKKITIPFSESYRSTFEYDANAHIYYKFHENEQHIDEETGDQIQVANVIVQKADSYLIAGDDAGRRDVNLIGSGKGYLITNGGYVPISWEKESVKEPTRWYGEDGEKLTLNKGKTWICVYGGEPIFENEQQENGDTENE